MDAKTLSVLFELTGCHSTPGDEDAVAAVLLREWKACGCQTETFGRYAVTATRRAASSDAPTVLICAHMDSPGYILQSVDGTCGIAIPLGGPHIDGPSADVWVKQRDGVCREAVLAREEDDKGQELVRVYADFMLQRGDRICMRSGSRLSEDGEWIEAPFLDNRLGCMALCEIMRTCVSPAVTVVAGATCEEEMTGFGASVLARQCAADFVICLDGTYESLDQNVVCGGGPVLTVTDKSVLLGMKACQALERQCQSWGIPLQMEVYNYSGTDARAFPSQGVAAPAVPILIATRGNHSQLETAKVCDVETGLRLLQTLCCDADGVHALMDGMGRF